MKRFQILTEADARVLDHGSSVVLVRGGQVTPLAADTLRARRVTVIRESGDADSVALAPVSEIRVIAIGSDHNGVALKQFLRQYLRSTGLAVHDLGTDSDEAVDYPDIAATVARQVARREADAGVVIDGTGMGSVIAANKIHGIRAAMCLNPTLARYARQHNGANVLSLGASFVTEADAREVLEVFIRTPMREPRYLRRLLKIRDLETDG
jgi:ribose 5-phosphate isomerase B